MAQSAADRAMWSKIKPLTLENTKLVPHAPGIYVLYHNGTPVYVGVASHRQYSNLRHRLNSYREQDDYNVHPTKKTLRQKIDSFKFKPEPIKKARKEEHDMKQSLPYNMDSKANEEKKKEQKKNARN